MNYISIDVKFTRCNQQQNPKNKERNKMKENGTTKLKDLLTMNEECKLQEGTLCAYHCRDCRYLEMDNNFWNDGTRRCDWKGRWVKPSDPACGYFKP